MVMIIFHIFADMENVIDTIKRMSNKSSNGIIPMKDFYNERRRLDTEELSSLRIDGKIVARKLVNEFGIELK